MLDAIKIIECPRDAMQGMRNFIPSEKKIALINALLKVGFDTIDFGSFVSPKAIPQLKDTAEVLDGIDLSATNTRLLAIIANTKGAEIASAFEKVSFTGFPFSLSPTFLKSNINSSFYKSIRIAEECLVIAHKHNQELVLYFSMAFGNPYGDEWCPNLVKKWVGFFAKRGVKIIALSDTIGVSDTEKIHDLFTKVIPAFPEVEFGFHLHTEDKDWHNKIEVAYDAGCRRFDGVINGMGGCPMAKYELVGNLNTKHLVEFLEERNIPHGLDMKKFEEAAAFADQVFNFSVLDTFTNNNNKI
jgi:hydroxymethylglutaryl-CoA lyase